MKKQQSKSGRSNSSVLFALFLAVLVDMLGVGIVIVVMAPYIKSSELLFAAEVGQDFRNSIYLGLVALFGLAQFFGAPMLGGLSDLHGRKKVVISSMVGGALGYFIFGMGVINAWLIVLFLGRFITGFFSGSVSILYSIIADLSTPENRAKNFGLLGAAFGVGFILGPVVGAYLADESIVHWFNDSTPFFAAMLLSLVSALLIHLFVPETRKAINENASINPFQGFKNIKRAFAIPELKSILLVLFLVYLGFTFFTQFSSVYLLDQLDFTERELGKFFAFVGLCLFITQMGIIRLVTKYFQSAQIVSVVLLTLAAGLVVFLIPQSYTAIFIVAPLIPVSFGLLQPNMLSIISNSASSDIQGQILGIQQSIRSLGFTIPPLIAAYISSIDVRFPNLVGAVIVVFAWIIFLVNYKQFKTSTKQ